MSENWVKDLGLIYESHRGVLVDSPRKARHQNSPSEHPKLSIRDTKIGTQVPDRAAASLSGQVPFGNPFNSEQEEGFSGTSGFIKEELSKLNPSNPTDRVAILSLNNVLKRLKETES